MKSKNKSSKQAPKPTIEEIKAMREELEKYSCGNK